MAPRNSPTSGPFFVTHQQRIAFARERLFEEGERPTGLVPEPVIQSWLRCLQRGRTPTERAEFDHVSTSRSHYAVERNRKLLESAHPVLRDLDIAVHRSGCRFILTDAQGVVLQSSPTMLTDGEVVRLAARVGVNLCEDEVGTTAPGVVVKTGSACKVNGAEHFHDNLQAVSCAASPIRNASGSLVAVLDVSIEHKEVAFDLLSLVCMYATEIENRLLVACSRCPLLLRLQISPTTSGQLVGALIGVENNGTVAWMNAAAHRLLMRSCSADNDSPSIEDLIGESFDSLLSLAFAGSTRMCEAGNGLNIWVNADPLGASSLQHSGEGDGIVEICAEANPDLDAPLEPVVCSPPSLQEASRRAIEQALVTARGNVSEAARSLQVSRGLIYRRMKEWGELSLEHLFNP